MNNFELYNPTKLLFGNNEIEKLTDLIPKKEKILILYGGGSIKKNGIYSRVLNSLKDREIVEFSGIKPNPDYDYLLNALKIIKEEKITYLLAVGGGSIIDATKFLASAALYKGSNYWDILSKGIRTEIAMPFGTVLTLPATGSEMNSGAVITNKSTGEKLGMGGPGLFPQFSILEPNVIDSLPKNQLINGLADSFVHVLEQYATYPTQAFLQDRIAESILITIIEIAPKVLENNPDDYTTKSNFMWCCTMALNGLIQKGVPTDWGIHAIGHELTNIFKIDHGKTLAIILPSYYRNTFENKKEKLAQMAERVFNYTEGTIDEKAEICIIKITEFFNSIGIKTKLSEYTNEYQGTAEKIENNFNNRGWLALGEHQKVTPKDVCQIVKNSY